MRTPSMNAGLERALSGPRLGRYMADSGGILDAALSLYERNARLAEAFYRPLQSLEVCLRNHMDLQLTARYGTNWFKNGGPPFQTDALEKINAAMDDLRRAGMPQSPGAVVAELSFGFWVMLLGRKYDSSIWRSTLTRAFLEGGRKMPRQRVHNRMDEIRKFRNRVAHHEPIYHRDPAGMHTQIIQSIAWMCPDSAAWALEHSRMEHVLDHPWP